MPLPLRNVIPIVSSLKKASVKNQSSVLFGFLFLIWLQACRVESPDTVSPATSPDQYSADVALAWSDMQLKLVRNTSGFAPPVAARSFGYAGLTLYEAVVPGLPERRSMAGQLQQLTKLPQSETSQPYNWVLSANAAQALILKSLFANTSAAYKARIDSLERALYTQYKSADESVDQRSAAFGKAVATAIFEWSKTDGGHEGYSRIFPTDYSVPTGPGMWQPTENKQKIPMLPYWGKNRTFLAATSTLPMPTPLTISTDVKSQYFAQYLEVYTKNKALTQTEKEISVWWADDPSTTFTPPGHSYNLARIAIKKSGATLGKAAEALARTGIGVSDAFVACWKCKYTFNNERPYTYVRRAIDPNWIPFWPSPPFPGYSSGHATQSAASATVLADLFGDNFAFTDDTHIGRIRDTARNTDFKARSFKSFWETAEESALSRFLGGIHTRQDNDTGLREGRKIGQYINALQWEK